MDRLRHRAFLSVNLEVHKPIGGGQGAAGAEFEDARIEAPAFSRGKISDFGSQYDEF